MPNLIIHPSIFSGREGDMFVLTCRNTMNRNASITWSNVADSKFPDNFIVNEGILIIRDAKIEHSGIYTCTSRISMPDGTVEMIMEWAGVYIAVNNFNVETN